MFIKDYLDINEADQKDPENRIKIQNINPIIVEDFLRKIIREYKKG